MPSWATSIHHGHQNLFLALDNLLLDCQKAYFNTHTHTATNKQTCTCVPTSIYYTTIPLHIIRMQTYHSQQVPSMSMPMRPCSNMSSGPSITSIKGPGQVCTCCTLVPQTASVCYNMKYMCMHTGMHLHTAHYHKYVYTIALHIALQQARHMLNIYIYIYI